MLSRERIFPAIIFLFVVLLLWIWQSHKPRVTVLPVTTSTETLSSVARDLTAIIVMELLGSSRFSLTDTADVENTFKRELSPKNDKCDEACQKRIGRRLMSKWVVVSELQKPDFVYVLTVRVMNIHTGQIEFEKVEKYTGTRSGLTDKTKIITQKVRELIESGKFKKAQVKKTEEDEKTSESMVGFTVVSAGAEHTCAMTSQGTVRCWGGNGSGMLGTGSDSGPETCEHEMPCGTLPVEVKGLRNAIGIAAGDWHTCALTSSGEVQCWGSNDSGQLGRETSNVSQDCISDPDYPCFSSPAPVRIAGFRSSVLAVAAGGSHTCALTLSGGGQCWGNNKHGQLGSGMTGPETCGEDKDPCSSTPVEVVGLSSGVVAITAGAWHTCASSSSGGVKCWGMNYGHLGDGKKYGLDRCGQFPCSKTPVEVVGLGSSVSGITAGWMHTCAIVQDGEVYCWGINESGQLGITKISAPVNCGIKPCSATPIGVPQLKSGTIAISASNWHTCAITFSGGVKCWGNNLYGQLGNTQTGGETCGKYKHPCSFMPVDVTDLNEKVTAITTGWNHTCAVTASGSALCWGANRYGQLGNGTKSNSPVPSRVSYLH